MSIASRDIRANLIKADKDCQCTETVNLYVDELPSGGGGSSEIIENIPSNTEYSFKRYLNYGEDFESISGQCFVVDTQYDFNFNSNGQSLEVGDIFIYDPDKDHMGMSNFPEEMKSFYAIYKGGNERDPSSYEYPQIVNTSNYNSEYGFSITIYRQEPKNYQSIQIQFKGQEFKQGTQVLNDGYTIKISNDNPLTTQIYGFGKLIKEQSSSVGDMFRKYKSFMNDEYFRIINNKEFNEYIEPVSATDIDKHTVVYYNVSEFHGYEDVEVPEDLGKGTKESPFKDFADVMDFLNDETNIRYAKTFKSGHLTVVIQNMIPYRIYFFRHFESSESYPSDIRVDFVDDYNMSLYAPSLRFVWRFEPEVDSTGYTPWYFFHGFNTYSIISIVSDYFIGDKYGNAHLRFDRFAISSMDVTYDGSQRPNIQFTNCKIQNQIFPGYDQGTTIKN